MTFRVVAEVAVGREAGIAIAVGGAVGEARTVGAVAGTTVGARIAASVGSTDVGEDGGAAARHAVAPRASIMAAKWRRRTEAPPNT